MMSALIMLRVCVRAALFFFEFFSRRIKFRGSLLGFKDRPTDPNTLSLSLTRA